MAIIKVLHVLCVFIWMGSLMFLSRFMGYHVKEDDATQLRLGRIYKRIYNFIELPTMIGTLVFGGILLTQLDFHQNLIWFAVKMSCAAGLIICDLACGRFVTALSLAPDHSRGIPYKVLHGVAGLLLIGVLVSIYVLH